MTTVIDAPPKESTDRDFVISRTFDVPRDRVFQAWTEPERMKDWWGPKGFTSPSCALDLRPGGSMHYCMRSPDGREMWGKFVYREVTPPVRLVYVNSFSDAQGGLTRHPMNPTWPLELLSTITFDEQGGKTILTIRWGVMPSATDDERKTFHEGHTSMQKGWTGTLDQLEAYLADGRAIVSSRIIEAPREVVFGAFGDPQHLAHWWGPTGFTNTFREFDLRAGGHWRFVMHGPDGADFENHSTFVEVAKPERVVFDHVNGPRFQMTQTYEDLGGKTRLTWRMCFASAAECEKVKSFAPAGIEQNFDRLEAHLAKTHNLTSQP